jgi:hypothetical protein
LTASGTLADHPVAHTHIGKNPTWQPDWNDPGNPAGATDPNPNDDNKLWLFAVPPIHPVAPTPGWPEWGDPNDDPFLLLVPEVDAFGDPVTKPGEPEKALYICRFSWSEEEGYGDPNGWDHVNGWHSALGPQGVWNLDSTGDPQVEPAWNIALKRESASVSGDDFFMLLGDDTAGLTSDGATYNFAAHGEKMWEEDDGAWIIHSHTRFCYWLEEDQVGQTVSATLSAFDEGGVYQASDPFAFRFAVVPEPAALALLVLGAGVMGRRR